MDIVASRSGSDRHGHIHRRPSWAIADSLATPEAVYLNRRTLLQGMGLGWRRRTALGRHAATDMRRSADPTADLYPAKRNEAYKLDRDLTPEEINANYNNFYEYGTQKEIAEAAQALRYAALGDRDRRPGGKADDASASTTWFARFPWRPGSTGTAASKPGR